MNFLIERERERVLARMLCLLVDLNPRFCEKLNTFKSCLLFLTLQELDVYLHVYMYFRFLNHSGFLEY